MMICMTRAQSLLSGFRSSLLILVMALLPAGYSYSNTFTVTHTGDTGAGSLRWCILSANSSGGPHSIVFDIPGIGPHTIQPATPLPWIIVPVTIDGYSQDGSEHATDNEPAALKIVLDGSICYDNGFGIRADTCTITGMAINRFGVGIYLDSVEGVEISGNHIGTDLTGMNDLGNGIAGIYLLDSQNNTIGGLTAGKRNILSGNTANGLAILGSTSTGNKILGNYIGIDASGLNPLGNGSHGIFISGEDNTIGGSAAGAGNVISGNDNHGISIDAPVAGNCIVGNYIGTDKTGLSALGNAGSGVRLLDGAFENTVGGSIPNAGNVISSNGSGVDLMGTAGGGNRIIGNLIGTDKTGSAGLGNDVTGVYCFADSTAIGDTIPGAGNIIASSGLYGITLGGNHNHVHSNIIGTDVAGTADLGHVLHGITVSGSDNTIGGPGIRESNTIVNNGDTGVVVLSGSGHHIRCNEIRNNGGLGIDLNYDGVTLNDPGDADTGANDLQNFPITASALFSEGTIHIQGNLNSEPDSSYVIDFYANSATDPTGYGEGGLYLGSDTVTTDVSGNAPFTAALEYCGLSLFNISATATNQWSGTSEFSETVAAVYIMLDGSLSGTTLELSWTAVPGSSEYWVFGTPNDFYFPPVMGEPYSNRLATLSSSSTTWSTTLGIGDENDNWSFLIVAVDASEQEICRSDRFGEFDFLWSHRFRK